MPLFFGIKVYISCNYYNFCNTFLNILSISIFALYSNNSKIDFFYLFKSIVKNPLIIACVLGALINFSEIKIPISIENLLKILSSAALPLGLISIGYTLVLKEIKVQKRFNCHYDFTKSL